MAKNTKKTMRRDKNSGYSNDKTFLEAWSPPQTLEQKPASRRWPILPLSIFLIAISFSGTKERGHNSSLNKPPYSESYLNIHSNPPAFFAEQQCNAVRTQVPPVFKRTFDPYDQFRELLLTAHFQLRTSTN